MIQSDHCMGSHSCHVLSTCMSIFALTPTLTCHLEAAFEVAQASASSSPSKSVQTLHHTYIVGERYCYLKRPVVIRWKMMELYACLPKPLDALIHGNYNCWRHTCNIIIMASTWVYICWSIIMVLACMLTISVFPPLCLLGDKLKELLLAFWGSTGK